MLLICFLSVLTCTIAQYVIPSGYTDTFQVHSPYSAAASTKVVNTTVLQFTFGTNGQTHSEILTPPSDTSFSAVAFTLQVVGNGTQYDRLVHMALSTNSAGNFIEIWRSSTFEPTSTGVFSTYQKDMTTFISLLKSTQTVQMEIDNYVSSTYTGNFAVQVQASYYYGAKQTALPPMAIFPATSSGGTTGSGGLGFTTIRGVGAGAGQLFDNSSVTIPRNTYKAVVNVLASGAYTGCGSSGNSEEFWWASSSGSDSSFRELQVYVDGKMAGVGWPFPVVYTGGVSPGYWRPVVAINAYDSYPLPVDVTPFLGVLTDGNAHTISVTISGIPASQDCGAGWFLGGRLETWQNSSITQTIATGFTSNIQPKAIPAINNNGNSQAFTRKHTTSATINGMPYSYSQSLSFSNTVSSSTGAISQSTTGTDTTNSNTNSYSWPITYNGTRSLTSSQTQLSHEFHLSYPVKIDTTQTAKAISKGVTSYGTNQQTYTDGTGYSRTVTASMGAVQSDSNPMLRRRRSSTRRDWLEQSHEESMAAVEGRALPPFLQSLLAGPLGLFFDGTLGVSQASLTLIEAALEAVGAFDPSIAPKQVQFAPGTKVSQGSLFMV